MKLNIGETIKRLRKEREITQEEFAEVLGVSCQSVSRWENHLCYPDIELIPTIAAFFGISTDRLMGLDETKEMQAVNKYLDAFQIAVNKGNLDECITIARKGVAEFPNNYVLLNKLMYALFGSGDDDGNIPEWKENMEKYDAEIIALGERIIKYCPDINLRLEAASRLAFHHILHDRKELGKQIYATFPSMEFCKERQMWWALEKDEELPFLRNAIKQSYEFLKSFIWLLADADVVDAETELIAISKIFELEKLILDGNRPQNAWGDVWLNFDIAKRYALMEDFDNTFRFLHSAVSSAKAFDSRPDEQKYTAVLVGEITERKLDFETSDTRPLCEILRDKWLIHDELDPVRETEEFKAIIKELSEN
ncbi:MAG: helix-turn-helix transcriptional regulator [Ruminococcaceae bacterium]|nr:helix-turn-helix transcriptional regulator [Oscillospiraceae bacterium]